MSVPLRQNARIAAMGAVGWLYACIHLNRQLPGILSESIRRSLQLDDQQLGALSGTAFSVVFALLGLYFGWRADHAPRGRLLRRGAWVWSVASAVGAFAPNYAWLTASRAGMAAGEAMAASAAISLMAQLGGDRLRARAISLTVACAYVGAGLASVLGGALVERWGSLPWLPGWRAVMLAAALPGVVGALLLPPLDEPPHPVGAVAVRMPRGLPVLGAAAAIAVMAQMWLVPALSVPLAVALALAAAGVWFYLLWKDDPSGPEATLAVPQFRLLLLAAAAVLFVDFAGGFWLLPYAQRQFGLDATTVGARLGALTIVGGVAGAVLNGWIADRWRRRTPAGRAWAVLSAVLLQFVSLWLAATSDTYPSFIIDFGLFCLASGGWAGVIGALGLDIVRPANWGTGIATYFLVTTLLGPAIGPFAVGLASDATGSLGHALRLAAVVELVAIVGLAWLSRRLGRTGGPDRPGPHIHECPGAPPPS